MEISLETKKALDAFYKAMKDVDELDAKIDAASNASGQTSSAIHHRRKAAREKRDAAWEEVLRQFNK